MDSVFDRLRRMLVRRAREARVDVQRKARSDHWVGGGNDFGVTRPPDAERDLKKPR